MLGHMGRTGVLSVEPEGEASGSIPLHPGRCGSVAPVLPHSGVGGVSGKDEAFDHYTDKVGIISPSSGIIQNYSTYEYFLMLL